MDTCFRLVRPRQYGIGNTELRVHTERMTRDVRMVHLNIFTSLVTFSVGTLSSGVSYAMLARPNRPFTHSLALLFPFPSLVHFSHIPQVYHFHIA